MQNISKKRAAVSRKVVGSYFQELEKSMDGVPPQNVINYDETNLSDDPGISNLIIKWGSCNAEQIMNSSKASANLMQAETGAGEVLPVYVVYKNDPFMEHLGWRRATSS